MNPVSEFSPSNFFVSEPKVDFPYPFESEKWGKNIVLLKGKEVEKLSWIDFGALVFGVDREGGYKLYQWLGPDGSRVLSNKSISHLQGGSDLPSILVYRPKDPDRLITCDCLTFDPDQKLVTLNGERPAVQVQVCNESLRIECQNLVQDVKVVVGAHPIFTNAYNSDFVKVEQVYQQFIQYNDDGKLQAQYKTSESLCHIRAHFMVTLLSLYGISAQKVYKLWNEWDWQFFHHDSWAFHSAVMICDHEGEKRVVDPWVGLNKKLLTLNQWTRRKGNPIPRKLVITSHVVISDFEHGSRDDAGHCLERFPPEDMETFQYLWANAVPNPPEFPLPMNDELVPSDQLEEIGFKAIL